MAENSLGWLVKVCFKVEGPLVCLCQWEQQSDVKKLILDKK